MKILSAHPSSKVKFLKTVYPWLDSASVPCCVQRRFTKSIQIWVECVRVIISIPGSSATFPVLFFFLFSRVSFRVFVRYGKKGQQNVQLAIRFRAFYPTGIKGAKCITSGCYGWKNQKKKRTALPCFSNLSHHATASLHVKFDSKVVACCRRTPRTCYEGGKRRSLSNDVWQNKLQCFVPQLMVTLQPRSQWAIPSSQGKAPWGQGW